MSDALHSSTHPQSYPIPVIAGPTAAGKSALAVRLCHAMPAAFGCVGEVVSCDSRQIYDGMDIGTAKPDPADMDGIRHHLIGELSLHETWSAGEFKRHAEQAISGILARGNMPVVTGGSTLYLTALLDGLARTPDVPNDIRESLNLRVASEGAATLYKELSQIDPAYARTLDETKSQRIVRGLEVHEATGRTLSSFYSDHDAPAFSYSVFALYRSRPALYAAIDARVDTMISAGLMDEVRRLHALGYSELTPALKTIGYQELFPVIRGEINLDEAISSVKRNSRRYAKRQLTWLRRLERTGSTHKVVWLDVDAQSKQDLLAAVLNEIQDGSTTNRSFL